MGKAEGSKLCTSTLSQMLLNLYVGSISLDSICLNLTQADLRKWDKAYLCSFPSLTFHDIMKSMQSSTNIC